MLARAAVRDVARVLGMPYGEADRVAKTIPFGTTLTDSRRMSGELRDLEQEAHIQRLLDLAEKVEGLVRSTGTHAAGVVISREPITQLVPLERSKGNANALQTQYEDKQLEKLGVLKFDFLGLGTLTILEPALRLIQATRGMSIKREDIPLDDRKTFELLGSGETTGMFQLESAGMRRYVRELKPDRVEDVMAMVALFRPGPMDYIPTYIRRKHGEEPVTYAHPTLEPVLKSTYGIIAYHTAYLKANYTTEYMTAVLSAEMGTPDRIAIAVAECRRMGLAVLPPDVNESELDFAITPKGIRFGLGAVKNVGEGAVEGLIEARRADGPFRSLDDLCARIDLQRANKRVLESLINCGACDAFGPRQAQLTALDGTLATTQREQRDRASGQVGLFDLTGTSVLGGPLVGGEAPRRELLGWEKELLGIYLSEHPLQALAPRMGDVVTAYLAELRDAGEDLVTIACVVTSARKHITKNKQLMMFAQVEDLTGTVEVTVFPRTYEATAGLWNADEILLVLARVEQREEEPKLLCEHAARFDDEGIREIRRVAEERRQIIAKRAKFARNGNGNGGPTPPAPRPPVRQPSAESPAPGVEEPSPQLVIRVREVLDY